MSDAKLWCIHMLGADDLHPKRSREEALDEANALNILLSQRKRKHVDPFVVAIVVEWPGTPEAHAATLAKERHA